MTPSPFACYPAPLAPATVRFLRAPALRHCPTRPTTVRLIPRIRAPDSSRCLRAPATLPPFACYPAPLAPANVCFLRASAPPPLSNAPRYRSLDTAHPRNRDPASVCFLRASAPTPPFAFFAHPRPRQRMISSRIRDPASVCFLRASAPTPPFAFFAHPRPRQRLFSSRIRDPATVQLAPTTVCLLSRTRTPDSSRCLRRPTPQAAFAFFAHVRMPPLK